MRIMGIDGATNKTGIAIFEDGKYEQHILIDLHKIKDASERIPKMMIAICEYINEYHVDKVIMEKSMLTNNIDTVQKLSNLAGAVMLYTYSKNILFEYQYPSQWRKAIGLIQNNKIKKEILKAEAIFAVKQEYGLDVTDDVAEAILIARSGFDLPKIELNYNIQTIQNDWRKKEMVIHGNL